MIKGLNIDLETLAFAYRAFGRETVKRALTVPASRLAPFAARNKDELGELVAKRDRWVDATLEFAEELANLDSD